MLPAETKGGGLEDWFQRSGVVDDFPHDPQYWWVFRNGVDAVTLCSSNASPFTWWRAFSDVGRISRLCELRTADVGWDEADVDHPFGSGLVPEVIGGRLRSLRVNVAGPRRTDFAERLGEDVFRYIREFDSLRQIEILVSMGDPRAGGDRRGRRVRDDGIVQSVCCRLARAVWDWQGLPETLESVVVVVMLGAASGRRVIRHWEKLDDDKWS